MLEVVKIIDPFKVSCIECHYAFKSKHVIFF
jgi:hypothetical protein